jgi:hyperosmotically inducible protein
MRILTLLLVFCLVLPMLVAQTSKDDDRIYDEIRRRLANDVTVKGAGLDVTVKSGAVTLRGKVHTDKAREKAEQIAKKVKGVVSVDNKLTLIGAPD